jgi:antirestriction protein ArdC
MKTQEKIYEGVTEKIVKLLEDGTVPWTRPWNPGEDSPMNFDSKRPYSGLNVWLLLYSPFQSKFWMTFKQIQKMGGTVKKGSKAETIVYWNFQRYEKENKDGTVKERSRAFLKEYKVFNLEQTIGIEIPPNDSIKIDFKDIESAEDIVEKMPNRPKLRHIEQNRAFYRPSIDEVVMPLKEQFKSEESYYATLFHELSHSTGHKKRLNRDTVTDGAMFGSHGYSKEELVAEFSSSFLCGVAGIDKEELTKNTAAYIESWSRKLKANPKWLVSACGQAAKAANFILDIKPEENKEK